MDTQQRNTQEEPEQSEITRLVNSGIDRETATRVIYAKPTHYSERQIKAAQKRNERPDFSLMR